MNTVYEQETFYECTNQGRKGSNDGEEVVRKLVTAPLYFPAFVKKNVKSYQKMVEECREDMATLWCYLAAIVTLLGFGVIYAEFGIVLAVLSLMGVFSIIILLLVGIEKIKLALKK